MKDASDRSVGDFPSILKLLIYKTGSTYALKFFGGQVKGLRL